MSINCCFELRNLGDTKHTRTVRFMRENIHVMVSLLEIKIKQDSVFSLTFISLCLQFSVSCIKLKIQFEQNDLIPVPYQFKRQDMRLTLHCESIDLNEAF